MPDEPGLSSAGAPIHTLLSETKDNNTKAKAGDGNPEQFLTTLQNPPLDQKAPVSAQIARPSAEAVGTLVPEKPPLDQAAQTLDQTVGTVVPEKPILDQKVPASGEAAGIVVTSAATSTMTSVESMQALHDFRLTLFDLTATQRTEGPNLFTEIEFQTSTAAALSYVMLGIRRFLFIMMLLVLIIIYTYAFSYGVTVSSIAGFLSTSSGGLSVSGEVLVAALSGMFGSVVSVLLRLGEFETTKGRSRVFLTLTGATLPVVGGLFGAFIAALLSSKIINITVGESGGSSVYLVIGFLSGFSERFSRGFIRIAENQFVGGRDRDTQQGISTTTVVTSASPDRVATSAASLSPTAPASRQA